MVKKVSVMNFTFHMINVKVEIVNKSLRTRFIYIIIDTALAWAAISSEMTVMNCFLEMSLLMVLFIKFW